MEKVLVKGATGFIEFYLIEEEIENFVNWYKDFNIIK